MYTQSPHCSSIAMFLIIWFYVAYVFGSPYHFLPETKFVKSAAAQCARSVFEVVRTDPDDSAARAVDVCDQCKTNRHD